MTDADLFHALGEDGLARIVSAFYRRVPADDILGPMYQQAIAHSGGSIADAEKRLLEFLIFRFGGPDRYVQQRGHPRLRMRHMPFSIDQHAARHWIAIMAASMDECAIHGETRTILDRYFAATAMFMVNK